MHLRNGFQRSRSVWIWLVLLTGSSLVIPGAPFLKAEPPAVPVLDDNEPPIVVRYAVGELLEMSLQETIRQMAAETHHDRSVFNEDVLREQTKGSLMVDIRSLNRLDSVTDINAVPKANAAQSDAATRPVVGPDCRMHFDGDQLVVFATPSTQKYVKQQIEKLKAYGFKQIVTEIRLISGRSELTIDGVDWQGPPTILNQAQVYVLLGVAQSDRCNNLTCPKITSFSGQQCTVSDLAKFAYTTIDPKGEAVVKTMEFGNEFQIKPMMKEDGMVRVEFNAELSRSIHAPKESQLPPGRRATSLSTVCELSADNYFAFRTRLAEPAPSEKGECIFILVRCYPIDWKDSRTHESSSQTPLASTPSLYRLEQEAQQPHDSEYLNVVTASYVVSDSPKEIQTYTARAVPVFEDVSNSTLTIRGKAIDHTDQESETAKKALAAWLKKQKIDVVFEGSFSCRTIPSPARDSDSSDTQPEADADRPGFAIEVADLAYDFEREGEKYSVSCDRGTLDWTKVGAEGPVSRFVLGAAATLEGHVRFELDGEGTVEADRVVIDANGMVKGDRIRFDLQQIGQGSADHFEFRDEDDFSLSGNVSIDSRSDGNGLILRGEQFKFTPPANDTGSRNAR